MTWSVHFSYSAEADLARLSKAIRTRVVIKLEWFEEHFDDSTPLVLSNEWAGLYKLRIGDYRVLYKINWDARLITVEAIDHRSKIYKKHK